MSQEWYFMQGDNRGGPAPTEALQQMAVNGVLGPDDMVWTAGMPAWDAARNIPLFFAQPAYPQQQGGWPQPHALQYGGYYNQRAEYAGFWLRFCAMFIDGIILWVVQLPVTLMTGTAPWQEQSEHPDMAMVLLSSGFSILLQWLYDAFQESSSYQATLGKRLVGIKVTDGRGQRISFGRATGRHFAKFISAIICGIGYLMAAFTDRKQALHDQMADTLVMKA